MLKHSISSICALQKALKLLHLFPQSKRQLEILKDVEGRLEAGRFTLLLG